MRRINRSKADIWFSLYIRERAKWACERCTKQFSMPVLVGNKVMGAPSNLHCSHIFGRRNKSVRFDKKNAYAHCFACHQWFTENPIELYGWVTGVQGVDEVQSLRVRAKRAKKVCEEEAAEEYKELVLEMIRRRSGLMYGKQNAKVICHENFK